MFFFSSLFLMLLYNHMCLLIWTVFSGERCGPWASCFVHITLKISVLFVYSQATLRPPPPPPKKRWLWDYFIFGKISVYINSLFFSLPFLLFLTGSLHFLNKGGGLQPYDPLWIRQWFTSLSSKYNTTFYFLKTINDTMEFLLNTYDYFYNFDHYHFLLGKDVALHELIESLCQRCLI